MASDKMKALLGFAKMAVAAVVGYAIWWQWTENVTFFEEWYMPYLAGLISAGMVFILLSKLNKGAD
ncbi:MAG: hypothetical protein N3G80_00070 [Candidatus Micrarchaeota archaeon]|nr:hypothetical protein [Candidatus Micrarchaeota archaeon]